MERKRTIGANMPELPGSCEPIKVELLDSLYVPWNPVNG